MIRPETDMPRCQARGLICVLTEEAENMSRSNLAKKKATGFSLIEIMIAVVVLATGLLALAALQGSLARNSAEAKVRGRVAAMLSAHMDQLRAGGYETVAADAATTTTAEDCATSARPWLCKAAKDVALGSLTVSQTVQVWSGAPGSGSFSNTAIPDPDVDAQFKRVVLAATWPDASGNSHTLTMSSDISALALRSSLVPPPDPNSSANVKPVVRQDDPAEAGMIPIAIGDGSQTAATNPKPIVVGRDQTLIETKFNVLTYQLAGGAAQVQQRVETTVIGCKCRYGNQGQLSGIYSQNFRPTYWDGTRYVVPKLVDRTNTSLRPVAGPVGAGSTDRTDPQSDLCTDCCRDHHDVASDTVKFDPFRTDAHDHYRSNNLSAAIQPSSGGEYNESCRVIRVDGFWRVATDARIVHFDYIGTGPDDNSKAPDPTYADNYETFVVDHLRGMFATTPADTTSADQRYAQSPAKHPASITIAANETRYQHTHGLLLDYIEPAAQAKISAAATNCTRTDSAECVLPHIPFTTINLTELSHYVPSNANVISVLDGGANFNDEDIIQGMVTGQTAAPQGTNVVTADASIKLSNTGLAAILPIDPQDAATLPTPPPPAATWTPGKQTYSLTNGTPTTGNNFLIDISPAFYFMNNGTTNDDPGVRWGTNIANTCPASSATASNPFVCHNSAGFSGAPVNITLSGYNKTQAGVGTDIPLAQRAVTCTEDKNNNPGTTTYTLTSSDPINICKNNAVLTGTGYSIVSVTSPEGRQAEQTIVNFSAVSGGDSATINFGPQADSYSFTCKYKTTGQGTTYTVVRTACP
jgi:Tfp pilus assembly protein PilV